jgi:rare lipoprotein A
MGLLLASCGSADKFARKVDPKYGVPSSPRVVADGQPIPKGGGTYRVGKPYMVAGRNYVPEDNPDYAAEGMASWYGDDFHGRLTANGEVFDKEAVTAAHPTLPMPSYVRVTNLRNRKSLIVRVNDRGPFHSDRVIDLSHKAADLLGFRQNGVARVKVEYVGRASLHCVRVSRHRRRSRSRPPSRLCPRPDQSGAPWGLFRCPASAPTALASLCWPQPRK